MTNEIETTAEVIAEVAAPQVPVTPEFKFDVSNIEVDIDVSSTPGVVRIASARMRKPEKPILIRREEMTLTEIVEASATEEDIVVEDERGNAHLFDAIATHVKGFRTPDEPKTAASEWREVTIELLEQIPSSFKAAFVRSMYRVSAKIVESAEDEGFVLGGSDVLLVDFFVGDEEDPIAVVRFEVPEPTETERRGYAKDAVKLRQPKGSRKTRNRIISNLGVAVKFFDSLMTRSGADISFGEFGRATVQSKTFSEMSGSPVSKAIYLESIDAIYKRLIVNAVMSRYNARVQD
jgi:hypothetical protein